MRAFTCTYVFSITLRACVCACECVCACVRVFAPLWLYFPLQKINNVRMIWDYKWLQCQSDLMTKGVFQYCSLHFILSGKLIRMIHVPFIKMSTCQTTPSKTISFRVSEDWYCTPTSDFHPDRESYTEGPKQHKTSSSLLLPQPKTMLMCYQLTERKWLSYDNIIQYHWEVVTAWMDTIFKRYIIVAIEQDLPTRMLVIILALIAVDHLGRYNWHMTPPNKRLFSHIKADIL